MLAENSSDFLARHAPDGTYRYASPASVAVTGYAPEDLVGTPAVRRTSPTRTMRPSWPTASSSMAQEQPATITYRLRRNDGELRWLETIARAVSDDAGVRELVSVTRDVSDRKQAELELSHAALHDTLTGLPNRALFLDRLGARPAPHRAPLGGRSRCCSSTSTASRSSTTRSATTPATSCWSTSPARLGAAAAPGRHRRALRRRRVRDALRGHRRRRSRPPTIARAHRRRARASRSCSRTARSSSRRARHRDRDAAPTIAPRT